MDLLQAYSDDESDEEQAQAAPAPAPQPAAAVQPSRPALPLPNFDDDDADMSSPTVTSQAGSAGRKRPISQVTGSTLRESSGSPAKVAGQPPGKNKGTATAATQGLGIPTALIPPQARGRKNVSVCLTEEENVKALEQRRLAEKARQKASPAGKDAAQ